MHTETLVLLKTIAWYMNPFSIFIDGIILLFALLKTKIVLQKHPNLVTNEKFMTLHVAFVFILLIGNVSEIVSEVKDTKNQIYFVGFYGVCNTFSSLILAVIML
jgi:hypothetical protein